MAKSFHDPSKMSDEELIAEYERLNKKNPSPEEMTDEQLIREYKALNNESPLQYAGRTLARTAKDVAAGVAGGADLFTMPAREVFNLISRASGSDYRVRPAQQIVNEEVDALTQGYTKPRNKGERMASAVGQELFGMKPMHGLAKVAAQFTKGRPKKAAEFIRESNVINKPNVMATAGATGGTHLYHENVENPHILGSLAAGTIGGVLGATPSLVSPILKDAMAKQAGKRLGWKPGTYESHQRAGIPGTFADMVESSMPRMYEEILYKAPFSHKRFQRVYKNRADVLKDKLGFGETDYHAIPEVIDPSLVREGALNYRDMMNAQQTALRAGMEPIEQRLVKNRAMVDVGDITANLEGKKTGVKTKSEQKDFNRSVVGDTLEDINKRIKEESKDVLDFAHSLRKLGLDEERVFDELKKHYSPEQLEIALKPKNKNISLLSLDQIRKKLLAKKTSADLMSEERRQASDLYEQVRNKKDEFIAGHAETPEQMAKLREANRLYAEYRNEIIDPRTGKEMGLHGYIKRIRETPTDEKAFSLLLSADPKYMEAVRKGLSQPERNDLLASMFAHMGEKDGVFNLSQFYNQFKKKKVLHKEIEKTQPNDMAREGLKDTVRFLAQNKRNLENITNTSVTSHYKNFMELIDKTGSGIYKVGSGKVAKGMEVLMKLGVSVGGGRYMAGLMTDPVVLARIHRVMTSKTPASQANHFNMLLKAPTVKSMLRDASSGSAIMEGKKQEEERHKPLKVKVTRPERVY